MKAIAPPILAIIALALTLTGCTTGQAPQSPPVVVAPRVAPPPPAPLAAPRDWRDGPQTPGTWTQANGQSEARFGTPGAAPLASLRCDRANARVLLSRAGTASAAVPMSVETSALRRPLLSEPANAAPGWLSVAIAANDKVLDAIAFSRGRFALEAAGHPTLYLPAWPELARVIEDCR